MNLGVYTWFPYQNSDRCTEVNDVTLLDSWVISAQGHFPKNTDLFAEKISKNLKGCPLKAIFKNRKSIYATNYVKHIFSNGSVVWYVEGFEYALLRIVLHQMNMTLFFVTTTEEEEEWQKKFKNSCFDKDTCVGIGGLGKTFPANLYFDFTSS